MFTRAGLGIHKTQLFSDTEYYEDNIQSEVTDDSDYGYPACKAACKFVKEFSQQRKHQGRSAALTFKFVYVNSET